MGIDSQPPLARVIDLLIDAVCVVDASGRFVYVGAAFDGSSVTVPTR